MHFRHCFHPAGHGTFFSGHIKNRPDVRDFIWVYDCGSKRLSHLRGLIRNFCINLMQTEPRHDRIELLCISHFDSEHVNGLDLFFRKLRVDTVVLPYMSLPERLLAASEMEEDEIADAAAVAALTLDPLTYFQLRGYGERIGRVILIRGHDPDGANRPDGGVPPPGDGDNLREPRDYNAPLDVSEGKSLYMSEADAAGSYCNNDAMNLVVRSDTRALGFDGIYEFVFYNKAAPKERAPKSDKSLQQVAAEAAAIVREFEMVGAKVAKPGWCQALKALYEAHFGSTGKEKNEISLCVYGRPILDSDMTPCELYRMQVPGPVVNLKLTSPRKTGVLMTGDSTLKKKDLAALQRHLGADRWQSIGMMQIPHHGSEHNWQDGNGAQCPQDYSVICAPGTQHHPHKSVLKDARNAILSTYGLPVAFDYHYVD